MTARIPEGWYDITVPLKQGMPYFPTDPQPPKIYRYHDRALGSRVTMSMLEIISHTGTHIDAPLHFIPDGSTISDMPLEATIGHFKEQDNLNKTHQTLLGAGIYILEDCALIGVPPGEYELLCLPLLMYKGDAGPCRAILRPLKK